MIPHSVQTLKDLQSFQIPLSQVIMCNSCCLLASTHNLSCLKQGKLKFLNLLQLLYFPLKKTGEKNFLGTLFIVSWQIICSWCSAQQLGQRMLLLFSRFCNTLEKRPGSGGGGRWRGRKVGLPLKSTGFTR